jgi:hypothetical protein
MVEGKQTNLSLHKSFTSNSVSIFSQKDVLGLDAFLKTLANLTTGY